GFITHHLHVALFRDVGIVHVEQLQHLALSDDVGGVGQYSHDVQAARFNHHLEGARVEKVTDEHAGGVAEYRVGGLSPAPQCRLVNDVVVQQGGGMNELDHRCQQVMPVALVAQRPCHHQQQCRSYALA